jgi:anti-sigma-K factor RskA
MMPADDRRWKILEKVGAYAAGELEDEPAREVERLLYERPDYRRLAESYTRMLVMLDTLGREPVEVPSAAFDYAIRRAYVSAFMRNAEAFVTALGHSYLEAFISYLGLRRGSYEGGT